MSHKMEKKIKKVIGRDGRRPGGETELAFIEVATKLFAEKGYNGTSISDISKKMNLTTASLYYHVTGKQQLLLRVLENTIFEFLDQLEVISKQNNDPKIKLRAAIESHLYFVLNRTDAITVFVKDRGFLEQPYKQQYQTRVERYDLLFTTIIRECIEARSIPPGDPHLIRLAILGMMNWCMEWYEPGGRLNSDEITKFFSDMITERMLAT
jgi:AcrR family transcriptional regulator